MKTLYGLIALAVVGMSTPAFAQWGDVTGKIVVKGDAPELSPLVTKGDNTVKDPQVCAANGVPDDSLVMGEGGELANCFIYLYQRRGTPDIHPDLKESEKKSVTFDNEGCQFAPHALVVRTDQVINVINSDACGHNVHTFPLKNNAYNVLVAGNDQSGVEMTHEQGELLPMQIKCDIHPWMTAYCMVVEHPYAVVTDKDGTFTIKNVPEGEHTFRIWHERVGYIERGLDVEIENGKTVDVGTIEVDADDL